MSSFELQVDIVASHFKPVSNEVDRIAEVRGVFEKSVEQYDLLNASAVGSVVFCLAQDKASGERAMFVASTSVVTCGGARRLAVRMTGEEGALAVPHSDGCPIGLIKQLSEPLNDQSRAWRLRCMERAAKNAEYKRKVRRASGNVAW